MAKSASIVRRTPAKTKLKAYQPDGGLYPAAVQAVPHNLPRPAAPIHKEESTTVHLSQAEGRANDLSMALVTLIAGVRGDQIPEETQDPKSCGLNARLIALNATLTGLRQGVGVLADYLGVPLS
jgi:hypothetical protein